MSEIRESVGAVAIGRNEGERLQVCLRKLVQHFASVVYVDSGSSDQSVDFAKSLGVHVIELDTRIPFNAARARNAGWQQIVLLHPNIDWIQFVDGDCELNDDWLPLALSSVELTPRTAVVCGRRRERFPEASIYNQMMDLEWNTPIGDAEACGGDSLVRVEALQDVSGFDETVAAGEEPEMCKRMREAGWGIRRIDAEMSLHDSAMNRFSQWWRRQRRSGYGAMDVTQRLGLKSFSQELRSARIWTLGWIGLTAGLCAAFGWKFGWLGIVFGVFAGIGLFSFQVMRIAIRERDAWPGIFQAVQYASILMLSKFASVHGQFLWIVDHWKGRYSRQIEYKTPTSSTRQASDPS